MKKKFILGSALFTLGVLLFFGIKSDPTKSPFAIVTSQILSANGSSNLPGKAEQFAKDKDGFLKQFRVEAEKIGRVQADPVATEQKLVELARTIPTEQLIFLQGLALSDTASGDERFLAAYLLAKRETEDAIPFLRAVALSPVKEQKNIGLVELDRQIRAQSIEGLGKQRKAPSARDAILDVVQGQADEFLRDRGHRALYEWQTGKPIEEQDKDALSKLLYEKKGS